MEREEDKYKIQVSQKDVVGMILKGKTGGEWGKLNIYRRMGWCIIQ